MTSPATVRHACSAHQRGPASDAVAALTLVLLVACAAAVPAGLMHEQTAAQPTKEPTKSDGAASPAAPLKVEVQNKASSSKVVQTTSSAPPQLQAAPPKPQQQHVFHSSITKRNDRAQLYSEPPGAEYRFYRGGMGEDRRRRTARMQLNGARGPLPRNKRDLNIDPDDALALLALWAAGPQQFQRLAAAPPPPTYYRDYYGGSELQDGPGERENELLGDGDEDQDQRFFSPAAGWGSDEAEEFGAPSPDRLNVMRRSGPALYPILPVYNKRFAPAAVYPAEMGPGHWGNFAPLPKRFMVSKRRSQPQQQVSSDVFSLAQLLSEHDDEEPQQRLYRRFMF